MHRSSRARRHTRGGILSPHCAAHVREQDTTPTLIEHGENDSIVLIASAQELYRTLKEGRADEVREFLERSS